MAKRTGQGKSRRRRSYEIEGDAKIIPIDRETGGAISKQEQLFREKVGRQRFKRLHTPPAILGVPDSARDRGSEESNRAERWLATSRVGTGPE